MARLGRILVIDALKETFVPVLAGNEWTLEKRPREYDSPDLRQALPFGFLHRIRGEIVEVANLQFDKYGTEKFRVEIGCHPQLGRPSDIDGRIVPPVGLATWQDPESCILSPSRWRISWFGFWPWEKVDKESADRLAKKLVNLWGEAENFLATGSRGPHLKPIGLALRNP